jgi:hypothetical protein
MREANRRCIICSGPVGNDGFIGAIKGMSVSFCKEHAGSCRQNCDTCVHAGICPAAGLVPGSPLGLNRSGPRPRGFAGI